MYQLPGQLSRFIPAPLATVLAVLFYSLLIILVFILWPYGSGVFRYLV